MLSNPPDPTPTVLVNGIEVPQLWYQGQPVVTFRQVDEFHQRPEGTARKAYNRHQTQFKQGIHAFVLQMDEAKALGVTAPSGLVVLTQRGYLKLTKPFTDQLSWDIQDELIDRYFTTSDENRRPSTDLDLVDAALSVAADPTLALQAMQRLGNALSVARAQLAEVAPDVEFARKVQGSAGSLTISDAAKACGDIGPRKMFEWLREHGYLMKGNMPYQWCINQGLFEVRISVSNAERKTFSYAQPLITGKGLLRVQRQMGCGESMPFELDANPGEVA